MFGARSYAWGGEVIKIDAFEVSNELVDQELILRTTESGFEIYYEDQLLLANAKLGAANNSSNSEISIYVRELQAATGTEFLLVKARKLDQIKLLQTNIRVAEKGKKTGILNVTLDSDDPNWAAKVLDHVSSQYVLQNVQRMSAEAEKSLKFLRSQLPDVKRELESTENALNEFRTDRRSVDISIETQALLTQIVELENEISALNLKKTEFQQQFKQGHPMFSVLNKQMKQLESKRAELAGQVDKLPDTQQKLLRLLRDMEVKTEIYTQLLNKAQELDVIRAGTVGNVRILDEAAVDVKEPIKPKKSLIVALAGVLGIFLGVVAALIRRALNRGIENPEQIENLGIPVYATIPFSKLQPKDISEKGILLADSHPEDLSVEAMRGLRTSIHFALVGSENKSIAITGPSPGVGKTFVSANLSALAAMGGDKVCVVDADMRRGTLHNYFHKNSENGLSEYLSGQIDLDKALQASGIANLDVICRGKAPPNPSELLMGQTFTDLLAILTERYD
jgi:tyrosine-protein kinase Etk/Wzc